MIVELKENQKIKVTGPSSLYPIMKEILMRENQIAREQEHFWTVSLRSDLKILNIELSALGSVDRASIEPIQVFRLALIKGATKAVLIHNHPPDLLTPSDADINVTDRMIQVGKMIGVEVDDHMIISERGYYSFYDNGLMDKLMQSKKFVVPEYIDVDRIKNEALKMGKEAGKKEGLIKGIKKGMKDGIKEVAQKLKKQGVSFEVISETTGLSIKEIEKL